MHRNPTSWSFGVACAIAAVFAVGLCAYATMPASACASAAAAPPAEERFELDNGVRVVIVHVPGAAKQAMFTFLPPSLATDPANRAQWSHLIEHLLLRTTDATALMTFDGGVFNGETGPECVRLETFCEADSWKEGLRRHAAWLTARSFSAESLEREKPMIAGEVSITSMGGFTHKWAVAAWNQIVRHGLDHAAVSGDVKSAVVDDAMKLATTALPIDDTVLVATIGPADPAAVRKAIEESIGAIPAHSIDADAAFGASNPREGRIAATWDLPTRHVMMWWKLPGDDHSHCAAAHAMGMSTMMRLMQDPPVDPRVKALVSPWVRTPEGAYLIVNAFVPDGADIAAVEDAIRTTIAASSGSGAIQISRAIAMQMGAHPDFDAQRAQIPEQYRDMAEGQWLLTMAAQSYTWGATREEIAAALKALDADSMKPVADILAGPETGCLVIEPAKE